MVNTVVEFVIAKKVGKDRNVIYPNTIVNHPIVPVTVNALRDLANALSVGRGSCVTKVTSSPSCFVGKIPEINVKFVC